MSPRFVPGTLAVLVVLASMASGSAARAQAPSAPTGNFGNASEGATSVSMGSASHTLPIQVPAGRGGVQPQLALYPGQGKGLGVPSISRASLSGWPRYAADPVEGTRMEPRGTEATYKCKDGKKVDDDPRECELVTPERPAMDRFAFAGQPLVPVCTVGLSPCPDGEQFPAWATHWHYFRQQHDNYVRFFWSPGKRTWRVQYPTTGATQEYGEPLAAPGAGAASIDTDSNETDGFFRWNLVREYDVNRDGAGEPVNVAVYAWGEEDVRGLHYLTDVYDTPPPASGGTTLVTEYAHHVRVDWESDGNQAPSHARVWRAAPDRHVVRVDVTSKDMPAVGERVLTRRYHVEYADVGPRKLIRRFWMEGRCGKPIREVTATVREPCGSRRVCPPPRTVQTIRPGLGCESLPPTVLSYTPYEPVPAPEVVPNTWNANTGAPRAWSVLSHAPNLRSPHDVAAVDVNSDGLVDLVMYDDKTDNSFPDLSQKLLLNTYNGFIEKELKFPNPNDWAPLYNPARDLLNPRNGASLFAPWSPFGDSSIYYSRRDINTMTLGRMYTFEKNGADWKWKPGAKLEFGSFDPNQIGDVDGDGFIDGRKVWANVPTAPGQAHGLDAEVWLSDRYPNGTIRMRTRNVASNFPEKDMKPKGSWLADMDGDGLADLVTMGNVAKAGVPQLVYFPGDGTGNFGCSRGTRCETTDLYVRMDDVPFAFVGFTNFTFPFSEPKFYVGNISFADVNADGFADFVYELRTGVEVGDNKWETTGTSVSVHLNRGGIGWSGPFSLTSPEKLEGAAPEQGRLVLGDVNGNGSTDLIYVTGKSIRYFDVFEATKTTAQPGLLEQVDNGLGVVTSYGYQSTTVMAKERHWSTFAPRTSYVVTHVQTSDGLPSSPPRTTFFEYTDIAYNGWSRSVRGFERIRTIQRGDSESPSMITETRYVITPCTGMPYSDTCKAEHLDNDPHATEAGQPWSRKIFDEKGTRFSDTEWTYRIRTRNPIYGLDGRQVSATFLTQTDAWLYDTSNSSGSTTEKVDATIVGSDVPDLIQPIPGVMELGDPNGRVHLRSSRVVDDETGLESKSINEGRVGDGGGPKDEPIVNETIWEQVSESEKWLFKPVRTQTHAYRARAGVPAAQARIEGVVYDALGRPTDSKARLTGTLPLDRFHRDGKATAPLLASASQDGTVLLAHLEYDQFGNLTKSTNAGNGCHSITYDISYLSLPTSATTYTGGCGVGPVTIGKWYDRGLAAVTVSTNPAEGKTSLTEHDGLGRVHRLFEQDTKVPFSPSATPSATIEYKFGAPISTIHTTKHNGPAVAGEEWAYVDGFGRSVVQVSAAEAGAWIARGAVRRNAKGLPVAVPDPVFWSGSPTGYPIDFQQSSPYTRHYYDAFGREIEALDRLGARQYAVSYGALSESTRDAEQLGPRSGAFDAVFHDGFGRIEGQSATRHENGALVSVVTRAIYQATGEIAAIERSSGKELVRRWMQHDSFGRMVLNAEPNTSANFGAPESVSLDRQEKGRLKAWRYAYDDAGRLVGTSDARGCGVNFHYDGAGHLRAEDLSPCASTQADYTAPTANLANGEGTEAFYTYDAASRIVMVEDLAARTVHERDARGRITATSRQLAKPSLPTDTPLPLATRYAPHAFAVSADYDEANRNVRASTGADVPDLLGPPIMALGIGPSSDVFTTYSARGTVKNVSSSYGVLLAEQSFAADGLQTGFVLGDATKVRAAFTYYDGDRRIKTAKIDRANMPASWSSSSTDYTRPAVLADETIEYDRVGNIKAILDARKPDDWAPGSKPINRTYEYDDAYRVTSVTYDSGNDEAKHPLAHELSSGSSGIIAPRSTASRMKSQSFEYDWQGNTTRVDDNERAFFERSLAGKVENGGKGGKPNQLRRAGPLVDDPLARDGLNAVYDDAGNLVSLTVSRASCGESQGQCAHAYKYDWDPRGQLARARRWDASTAAALTAAALAGTTPAIDQTYVYDADGQRVLKSAHLASGDLHSADIFGSLRLKDAEWQSSAGEYERTALTEQVYLGGLARIAFMKSDPLHSQSGRRRVFFLLGDHLGSSSSIIDQETGELVEHTTYQAYGAPESDFRPESWESFREDFKFTGKQDDLETGLSYFGARYYHAVLGRWISADPLTIHGLGADPNPYAYVSGRVANLVDPDGLQATSGWETVPLDFSTSASVSPHASAVIVASIDPGLDGTYLFEDDPMTVRRPLGPTGPSPTPKWLTEYMRTGIWEGAVDEGAKVAGDRGDEAGGGGASFDVEELHRLFAEALASSMYEKYEAAKAQQVIGILSAMPVTGTVFGVAHAMTEEASTGSRVFAGVGAVLSILPWAAEGFALLRPANAEMGVVADACATGACGGGTCFVAGTLVATEKGDVPIERLRLGDRVEAGNPACADDHLVPGAVTIAFAMPNPTAPLDVVDIKVVRSWQWLVDSPRNADGHVWLDLADTGLAGWAKVLDVADAPREATGRGCLVVTTLAHRAGTIVRIVGEPGTAPIEVTPEHRLFAVERGWVPAGELRSGDHLRTDTGSVAVARVEEAPGGRRVFNVEVAREHTYRVTAGRIWAHNMCPIAAAASEEVSALRGSLAKPALEGNPWSPAKVAERVATATHNGPLEAQLHGYRPTNFRSHGQPVYTNGRRFITPDVDGHNTLGGWKMADSVKNLGSKNTRMGTYDSSLTRIGD